MKYCGMFPRTSSTPLWRAKASGKALRCRRSLEKLWRKGPRRNKTRRCNHDLELEPMKLPATEIRILLWLYVAQLFCATLMAQTTDFHSETRLLLVDVVSSDESDQPILGLKPDDFKVLEDGKPQQIRFFDPHTAATQEKATQVPRELPPHVYNNVPYEDP